MKNELSVEKRIFFTFTVTGILWIVASLLNIVDIAADASVIGLIASVIVFVNAVMNCYLQIYSKQEKDDEMSEQEFNDACKKAIIITFVIVIMLLAIMSCISLLPSNFAENEITLKKGFGIASAAVLMILGILWFLIGYIFHKEDSQ